MAQAARVPVPWPFLVLSSERKILQRLKFISLGTYRVVPVLTQVGPLLLFKKRDHDIEIIRYFSV